MMIEEMLPSNPHIPMIGMSTARVRKVKIGNLLENSVSINCYLVDSSLTLE